LLTRIKAILYRLFEHDERNQRARVSGGARLSGLTAQTVLRH
jgi:hypothetical protein